MKVKGLGGGDARPVCADLAADRPVRAGRQSIDLVPDTFV
jgi:hypothetical protein